MLRKSRKNNLNPETGGLSCSFSSSKNIIEYVFSLYLFLEHSLHQLLRKAHKNNLNPETGGLSSSPVGVSKRRRIAGPRAADRKTLLKMATEETFLEQIIAQAQHVVLRLRAMFVLDQVSQNLRDPLINFHWSTLSSPTRTSVKVSL